MWPWLIQKNTAYAVKKGCSRLVLDKVPKTAGDTCSPVLQDSALPFLPSRELRAQQSRAIATSGSYQELLCLATGLACLLWLPQELNPLSRMPFGSGQVSPVELTVGHAVHQPELMCFIIYSHRAPVFI
ncbi:hypothetical protein H8959_014814 [Pygathrix nigripes]